MSLTLYELADEALALDALFAMDDGEVTAESEALALELAEMLAQKADAFGGFVRSLEANAAACRQEEERLRDRRKALENKAQWLKRVGLESLQRMDRPRVEGELFTLAVQNNPPSVVVNVLVDALPSAYVRTIPEVREPDKAAIGKALKSGEQITGCELVQTQSLRIR